jgi:hypothetical protein
MKSCQKCSRVYANRPYDWVLNDGNQPLMDEAGSTVDPRETFSINREKGQFN